MQVGKMALRALGLPTRPGRRLHPWRWAALLACSTATLVTAQAMEPKDVIKAGPPPPAVMFEHFPSRLHAYVWRNWELVDTALLAQTIGATPAQVEALATSLGLGENRAPSRAVQRQIYITIIKRNWHLLPLEQLLPLLGLTAEELEFRLREEDGLGLKLGSAKPACEPLRYQEPTASQQARAAEIRAELRQHFGDTLPPSGEMPLAFAQALQQAPAGLGKPQNAEGLRFIFSYFGAYGDPLAEPEAIDPYPEGLLARLADTGVNGIWLHVVLRQLAPGGPDFPEFGAGAEQRLESLRKLVARAQKYGLQLYLYMNEPRAMPPAFFKARPEMAGVHGWNGIDITAMCTSDARVTKWMGNALAHVFHEVPGLGGVFTITASENLTNCAAQFRQKECPRCKDRAPAEIIAEVNRTIEEGVHRSAPQAKVIAWDWGWAKHGEAADHIRMLPKNTWFMSVSEWAQPFTRGPVTGKVGEYSMSVPGPGPRARHHWQVAKELGLKTVAKVQLNNTWELSSLPYLPVMDLVAEHCAGLAKVGVDGLMLSWSLGGYPSPNLRLAQGLIDHRYAEPEAALQALAVEQFGAAVAPQARAAWRAFSEGFREFPYGLGLYSAPQQTGPANLLYRQPTGYRATMTSLPYDDLKLWRGAYPVPAFIGQFEAVARKWEAGLEPMRAAVAQAPAEKRAHAAEELRLAEAAYCYFASVAEQARFVDARDTWLKTPSDAAARTRMQQALTREVELAQRLYPLTRADSRIGFEPANHYYFRPLDLAEKVISCEWIAENIRKE